MSAINEHLARTRREWTPATPSTRIEDLGFDSFDVASIVLTLEEATGLRLCLSSTADVERVGDIAESVRIA